MTKCKECFTKVLFYFQSVWSDDANLQPHIGAILEFCDSKRQKTIQQLLDKINTDLPLVLISFFITLLFAL